MDQFLIYSFIFYFGAMIGSFLNALIYRLPRDIPVSLPRSKCTSCQKLIYWYENIPIFSYVFLRGKCSKCKSKISIRYPLVEILLGVCSLLLYPSDITEMNLILYIFNLTVVASFVVHFLVDVEHQILPNEVTLYLLIIFILHGIFFSTPLNMILGLIIGGGVPAFVTWVFYKLKGQIGLGFGDIKLYGTLGIFLGPYGVIQNIFLSCMLGAFVSLFLIAIKVANKNTKLAFGPYIIVIATLQIIFPIFFKNYISKPMWGF